MADPFSISLHSSVWLELFGLQLFEEIAGRAGDVHPTGHATLPVLDALYDTGGFGALGAVGALLCVHDLFAVTGLGNLSHTVSPESEVIACPVRMQASHASVPLTAARELKPSEQRAEDQAQAHCDHTISPG